MTINAATINALWNMYATMKTNENDEHFMGLNTVDIRHVFQNLGLKNPTKADYASLDDNGDDYISKPELMKFVVKMSKQQSAEFGKNKEPVVKKPKRSNGGGTAEVSKKMKRNPLEATLVLEVFDQYAIEMEQEGGVGMKEAQYGQASQALGFHPKNSDFDGLDANGDGFLTRGEFMKFAVRMSKRTATEKEDAEDSIFIDESL